MFFGFNLFLFSALSVLIILLTYCYSLLYYITISLCYYYDYSYFFQGSFYSVYLCLMCFFYFAASKFPMQDTEVWTELNWKSIFTVHIFKTWWEKENARNQRSSFHFKLFIWSGTFHQDFSSTDVYISSHFFFFPV